MIFPAMKSPLYQPPVKWECRSSRSCLAESLPCSLYLDGAIVGDDLVLHLLIPQAPLSEILQQVGIHNLAGAETKGV